MVRLAVRPDKTIAVTVDVKQIVQQQHPSHELLKCKLYYSDIDRNG